jgi:hypothetical protein
MQKPPLQLWRNRFNPSPLPLQPISSRRRGRVAAVKEEDEESRGCRERRRTGL